MWNKWKIYFKLNWTEIPYFSQSVNGNGGVKFENAKYVCITASKVAGSTSVSVMKLKVNRRAVSVVDLNTSQIRSNLIEQGQKQKQQQQHHHHFALVSTP